MKCYSMVLMFLLVYIKNCPGFGAEIRDLSCRSSNVEDYYCTWGIGSNDNKTGYSVTYNNGIWSKTQVCPGKRNLIYEPNDQTLTCRFHKDNGGSVHCQDIEVRVDNYAKSRYFCPRDDARANPPVNIHFPVTTSTSIEITWQKPGDVFQYDKQLRYQLEYRKDSTLDWKKPLNTNELKETAFVLTNLKDYTPYDIRLASKITGNEWGPWSDVHEVSTTVGVPGIVSNMSAIFEPESNVLLLEWTIPSEPNGPIDYFVVRSKFQGQEWSHQNTTNTEINIAVDCTNFSNDTILTTAVAAVNLKSSTLLRGEWARRDYPVCETYSVTTEEAILPNYDSMKVVNIVLFSIIVPSATILLIIIGKAFVKKYSKLDLTASPNLQKYKFKQIYHPAVEKEVFDQLRMFEKRNDPLVTTTKLSDCSCENIYESCESSCTTGVACHTKLAVNLSDSLKLDRCHSLSNDGADDKSVSDTECGPIDVNLMCQSNNVLKNEEKCPNDIKTLPRLKALQTEDSYLPHSIDRNICTSTILPAHTVKKSCEDIENGRDPIKLNDYVPHNTFLPD